MKEEGFLWGVEHIESGQLHAAFVVEFDAEKWRDQQNPQRYKVVEL